MDPEEVPDDPEADGKIGYLRPIPHEKVFETYYIDVFAHCHPLLLYDGASPSKVYAALKSVIMARGQGQMFISPNIPPNGK